MAINPGDFSFGLDGFSPGGGVLKRGIDIAVAGAMLLICFPLLVFCALLVKFDSRGPVLFGQIRTGRHFRMFRLLKLRTMRYGAEGPAITLGFDPRVTQLGRWLRRWKLDELPQLWNVLRGDMSLVGPRPVIPELTREFAAQYTELLQVRPGLTDPATLHYCHENEILSQVAEPLEYFRKVVTPEKLRLSRSYMLNATLAKDFGIMAKTVWVLFSPVRPDVLGPGLGRSPRPLSPASMSQD